MTHSVKLSCTGAVVEGLSGHPALEAILAWNAQALRDREIRS